jgi:hypothetical protein
MKRRDQISMTSEEIDAFLAQAKTMTIVSNGPGGYPHPMPMWFSRTADGAVRMTTYRTSQKIQNLTKDPKVALLVESGTEYSKLRGVVLYGEAELLDGVDLVIDTMLRITGGGQGMPSDPEQADALRAAMSKQASKRCVIQVKPSRIISWDHTKLGGTY